MKLFVDDLRKPYKGWALARTITDAIRILSHGYVHEISLDHDIQQSIPGTRGFETFEPVARYIFLMPESEKPIVHFHTGNIVGGRRMADIIGIPFQWTDYERTFNANS